MVKIQYFPTWAPSYNLSFQINFSLKIASKNRGSYKAQNIALHNLDKEELTFGDLRQSN